MKNTEQMNKQTRESETFCKISRIIVADRPTRHPHKNTLCASYFETTNPAKWGDQTEDVLSSGLKALAPSAPEIKSTHYGPIFVPGGKGGLSGKKAKGPKVW